MTRAISDFISVRIGPAFKQYLEGLAKLVKATEISGRNGQ
jgi:hypothetical protein